MTTPTTAPAEHLRAAFESAITSPPYEKSVARFCEFEAWPGNYCDIAVDLAWCMWQEASRAVRAEPDLLSDDEVQSAVCSVLAGASDETWRRLTLESGPYSITKVRIEVDRVCRAVEKAVREKYATHQPQAAEPGWFDLVMNAAASLDDAGATKEAAHYRGVASRMRDRAAHQQQAAESVPAVEHPDDGELEAWRSAADDLLRQRNPSQPTLRRAAHLLQNAYLFASELRASLAKTESRA